LSKAIPQFGDGLPDCLRDLPVPHLDGKEPVTTPQTGAKVSTAGSTPAADNAPSDETPVRVDLTATRTWGGPQTWRETNPPSSHSHRRN
jgi:hypothetical protein